MKNNLLSYAEDFASFFIKKFEQFEDVKTIILFGSVARGEAKDTSDIDIFIELKERNKNTEKVIEKIKRDFFESARFKQYWSLLGIQNEIQIISGTFEEWKDLKNSIISNGIVLYGRYSGIPEGKQVILINWEQVKNNSTRVFLNKKLFGAREKNKKYPGLIEKHKGAKIGKGAILIPETAEKEIQNLFKKYKIKYALRKLASYD